MYIRVQGAFLALFDISLELVFETRRFNIALLRIVDIGHDLVDRLQLAF